MAAHTMLRSFLSRSHPVLSHLRRSTGRHPCGGGSIAVSGGANRVLSRRYYSDSDFSDGFEPVADSPEPVPDAPEPVADATAATTTARTVSNGERASSTHNCASCGHDNRLPPPPLPLPDRKHLYVVVDDWKRGFSVHKLDLQDPNDDDQEGFVTVAGSEPRPPPSTTLRRLLVPVVRFEYPIVGRTAQFAALGSNIVAKGYPVPEHGGEHHGLTVVYDTRTAGQAIVHRLPPVLHFWNDAVAAGDRLYALTTSTSFHGASCYDDRVGEMHYLEETPAATTSPEKERWSWSGVASRLPFNLKDKKRWITSYAVHPGGRAISVSVEGLDMTVSGTYSYDTERAKWACNGVWRLPFRGEAHYDGELDAWVGLHRGSLHDERQARQLCSCDVFDPPSPSSAPLKLGKMPSWKLCEEKLTSSEDGMLPLDLDAALVSMGGGGWFCLVEGAVREREWYMRCWGDGDKCALRVSTFRLRYGKNGELIVAARRPARTYVLSRYVKDFRVRAFWM